MDNQSDQTTNNLGYEVNKSTKDLLSRVKVGAKKALGRGFDKIGGSLVKGLNAAMSLPTKPIGMTGAKMLAPILISIVVFVFVLGLFQTNSLVSSLYSGMELIEKEDGEGEGGGGGGGGEPFKQGEITKTEDGRIKSCGVGMTTNFWERRTIGRVTPEKLAQKNYDEQLKEFIGDQFGKRCGVVYAAHYLASDFDWWVPYYWAGKYAKTGLGPYWGSKVDPDKYNHIYLGLDCSGFNVWTQINGYGSRGWGVKTVAFTGDCEKIKSVIEPGDTIVLFKGGYHVAVVVEYNDKYIKFAHSGGSSGSSTGLIDICTGRGVDQRMNFEYLHHKNYPN